MNKIILLAACLLLSLVACKPSKNDQAEKVNQTLNQLVKENQLPGLNFSIIFADGHQENYSAGDADLDKNLPLSDKHVLFSGSIGKTYAVALLMQLVDEGKLDLNKRFIDYFPIAS